MGLPQSLWVSSIRVKTDEILGRRRQPVPQRLPLRYESFYHLKEKDLYVLWMGTFDGLKPFKFAGKMYIHKKPALYILAGDYPRLTGEEFMALLKGME